jgi:hypothetical protein
LWVRRSRRGILWVLPTLFFVGARWQAEDRAHRLGQTKNLMIYYCMARGTVDDIIWPTVNK